MNQTPLFRLEPRTGRKTLSVLRNTNVLLVLLGYYILHYTTLHYTTRNPTNHSGGTDHA